MEAPAMQTQSPELSPRTHRQRENLPQKLSRGLHIHTNAHTIIMIINKIKFEKDKHRVGRWLSWYSACLASMKTIFN